MNTHFADFNALVKHIRDKESGHILVDYRLLPGYGGMVLGIGIIFDTKKDKYELDLEWISFGLDLYAENLLEGYSYKFESLEALVTYLQATYAISVADIPIKHQIDDAKFPNPIKDAAQTPAFEAAWKRFKKDFKEKKFLDSSLQLVYTTPPFSE
ncbi:MAG: hypothetical protein ABI113_05455 [Mucilaginibacter sp.]